MLLPGKWPQKQEKVGNQGWERGQNEVFWSWHHWGATGGCASGSASPWPPGKVAGVAVRGWLSQLFTGLLLSTSEQRSLLCIPLKRAEPARTQLRAQNVPEDATIILPPCTSQGRVPAPEGCCSPRRDAQHSKAGGTSWRRCCRGDNERDCEEKAALGKNEHAQE